MAGFEVTPEAHYDSKAFKGDELQVAKALDKYVDYVWARNKDRLDIPLPIKSGSSSMFYKNIRWAIAV